MKGFSLLELLIYVAIFGMVVFVAGNMLVIILGGRDSVNARVEVLQNIRFASEKIRQFVYDSSSSTVSGVCPFNTLTAIVGSATTTVFVSNGALISSSTQSEPLTSNFVTATTSAPCFFTQIANPLPAKPTIQFNLTIKYNDNGNPELIFSDSVRSTISRR